MEDTRLDSWKAIAAYLNRNERTVRGWERELGLPVRRMPGGRGRSVFAYTSEIDAWLKTAPQRDEGESRPAPDVSGATAARRRVARMAWRLAVPFVVVVVAGVWRLRPAALGTDHLRLETEPDGVAAIDAAGHERWKYEFPPQYTAAYPDVDGGSPVVMTGGHPAMFVATSLRTRRADNVKESGELSWLDAGGGLERTFSFADRVTLHGTTYGPPWVLTAFDVNDAGGARRIAVAAHHYVWDASLVTVLDDRFTRLGTFVHAGWIESAHWVGPNRLLVGGFSNTRDGGMVALLDPGALNGQGPEPPGSVRDCEACGPDRPVRMVVLPRTEVNRASVSRFNRARVQIAADRIFVRTEEVPSSVQGAVDAIYEFTPQLDLIRASFSDRYWEVHRALEGQGQVRHAREQCPDRDGPAEIQVWEPQTGWRTRKTR